MISMKSFERQNIGTGFSMMMQLIAIYAWSLPRAMELCSLSGSYSEGSRVD